MALAALILLLPLVAMQFSDDVKWSGFDFALMAALLAGVGLGLELAIATSGDAAYRIASGIALAAGLLLVWINGAVGIIGGEREDANLLYSGVLAVALAGALAARFRPAGMALAMGAAALAQALVPVIAPAFAPGARAIAWSPEVFGLTGVFVLLWLASAWLFRKAARRQGNAG